MKQADLFTVDEEPDLFPEGAPRVVVNADPEKVRAKLHLILAEARAATSMPWTRDRLGYHQTVFPQMCRWLPDEEAAQLCFEFEAEVRRLLAA